MQHGAATVVLHGTLKALANKVLERNAAARHACNIAPNKVLHGGIAQEEPMRHLCNTPGPVERIEAERRPTESEELPLLGVERGYLTLDNLPELQKRLELSGWKVERRYDQLICWMSGHRKPRIQ